MHFNHIKKVCFFYFFLNLSSYAALWSSTNASYLYGDGHKDNPSSFDEKKSYGVITLEHASAWKYGDNFFFTDISNIESSNLNLYTEWAPRLSSSKIFKIHYGSFLTDILLATQLNVSPSSPRTQLMGVGFDLKIPSFDFLKFNIYIRDNKAKTGTGFQLTISWSAKYFTNIQFTGFIDYATNEGKGSNKYHANFLAQPQLLWLLNQELAFGIEYLYWNNKFGISGFNESIPQFMIRWTL